MEEWRAFILKLSPQCEFFAPASAEQIAKAEAGLKVGLPEALKRLLMQTNGVWDDTGTHLIWSAERIEKDNLSFRRNPAFAELFMPFDPLLFFADAGNGDQFAFLILAGAIRNPDVFAWNHEDDSRVWVAPSLEKYLEGATKRTLRY